MHHIGRGTMRPPRPNPYRDAWAGELDAARVGEQVRVAGWVHRRRDHGGLVFIDLRDRSGIVQLVFHPGGLAGGARARAAAALRARRERGGRGRPPRGGQREPAAARPARSSCRSPTAETLAESETPPFPLDDDVQVDEALRLRHRVLDLRRESMRDALTPAPHDRARDARLPQRARLPRPRDADPHPLDARGRARLPRARAARRPGRSTRSRSRRSCSSSC